MQCIQKNARKFKLQETMTANDAFVMEKGTFQKAKRVDLLKETV